MPCRCWDARPEASPASSHICRLGRPIRPPTVPASLHYHPLQQQRAWLRLTSVIPCMQLEGFDIMPESRQTQTPCCMQVERFDIMSESRQKPELLCCMQVEGFGQLLATRSGFAAAQATQNPICFSLIPELF